MVSEKEIKILKLLLPLHNIKYTTYYYFDPHLTHMEKGQGHLLFQIVNYVGTHVNTNASILQS